MNLSVFIERSPAELYTT